MVAVLQAPLAPNQITDSVREAPAIKNLCIQSLPTWAYDTTVGGNEYLTMVPGATTTNFEFEISSALTQKYWGRLNTPGTRAEIATDVQHVVRGVARSAAYGADGTTLRLDGAHYYNIPWATTAGTTLRLDGAHYYNIPWATTAATTDSTRLVFRRVGSNWAIADTFDFGTFNSFGANNSASDFWPVPKAVAFWNRKNLPVPKTARGGANFGNIPPNELVALQLLRKMVQPEVFRKYLKYGFVTVRGPSGLTYQIQRSRHHVKVWDQGQLLCSLCVYLRDQDMPPTDEVIAKIIIAECDEADLYRRANATWHSPEAQQKNAKILSLGDIARPKIAAAA